MSSEGFYYNGTKLDNTSTSTFTNSLSATIFAIKQANNPTQVLIRNPVMKLYSCKIWENNILVKNFIPCYRISDNVIGLYDLVTNTFFTNAGTGTFTKGSNAPTPDTPINIEVVTGTQEVKVENVNLLELKDTGTRTIVGITFSNDNENGTITANGTATANSIYIFTNFMTLKAGTYTLSGCPNGNEDYRIDLIKDSAAGSVLTPYDIGSGATITLTEDTYLAARIRIKNGKTLNNVIFKPQLEYGSTATDFVEHQEQLQTISLGDIELCKIGSYQDYLYKSGDKWYKKEYIGKVVLNGSETTWVARGNTAPNYWKVRNSVAFPTDVKERLMLVSNYFICDGGANVADYAGNAICGNLGDYAKWLHVSIDNTIADSVDSFKTWLATHNLVIYYIQVTPNDIEITNTTLIEQLDNLQKLKSYNGVTNINCSGNLSAILSVSAIKGES